MLAVRGNETIGEEGAAALIAFMRKNKTKNSQSVPRSLMGVTPKNSRLDVLRELPPIECSLLCAELEANVFSEGVSAGMGGDKKTRATVLNRRGASAAEAWIPLIWAAKDNNLLVAQTLLENGHDVNRQEPATDKGMSGYAPVHWAAQKGHVRGVRSLGTCHMRAHTHACHSCRRDTRLDGRLPLRLLLNSTALRSADSLPLLRMVLCLVADFDARVAHQERRQPHSQRQAREPCKSAG